MCLLSFKVLQQQYNSLRTLKNLPRKDVGPFTTSLIMQSAIILFDQTMNDKLLVDNASKAK